MRAIILTVKTVGFLTRIDYKNDCEHYEKGHKWQDINRVLPKDW